jgi:hypothetical protein
MLKKAQLIVFLAQFSGMFICHIEFTLISILPVKFEQSCI